MIRPVRLLGIVLTAGLVVTLRPAEAGPPMPRSWTDVTRNLPLGATIKFVMGGNCVARIPRDLPKRLSLWRGGKRVAGTWRPAPAPLQAARRSAVVAFHPAKPLSAGQYEVKVHPRIRSFGLGIGRRAPYRVTMSATPDRTPPTFAGLRSVTCAPYRHQEGCTGRGIGLYFNHPPAKDRYGAGYVLHWRRRGRPYRAPDKVIAEVLPWFRLPGKPRGRYVLTLLARDLAGNVGGTVCEVALTFPIARTCKGFPTARATRRVRSTPPLKARCARSFGQRRWRSRIDGVRFRL